MSSLRRPPSVTDSDDSEEEEAVKRPRTNRRLVVSPQEEEEEPSKVSDSEAEAESESEEERTKSKQSGKLQRLAKQEQEHEEEIDEIESESESGSDQDAEPEPVARPQPRSRNAKKEPKAKGPVKVPLVVQTISVKRGRDANGANGVKGGASTEEPSSKKMKQAAAKEDKARSQAEKYPSSPGKSPLKKERKSEQVMRGAMKGTASAAVKAEKSIPTVVALAASNAKAPAAGRKRKANTPPPATTRQTQAQKVEGDKSPQKPKKPFSWSSVVEDALVHHLHEDCSNGLVIPGTKVDPYWEKLLKRLPLDDGLTGVQLCDKVKRMRQRYFTLKERAVDGTRVFKSQHEEKMYQLWTLIWDSGPKVPQPTGEGEHSDDDSAETAATTAPRESSKPASRQSNGEVSKDPASKTNGDVSNAAETHGKGDVSISDDENEEEEEELELTQREVIDVNAASNVVPDAPFISKPRLAFTPLPSRDGKSKLTRTVEEAVRDHIEGPVTDDDGKFDVFSSGDQRIKQSKEELFCLAQEFGRRFFQGIEEHRNGSFMGGLGLGSVFVSGALEGLGGGNRSPAARELEKKWRELKIQELAVLSKRLQLMQEHCLLQQEELKSQNQSIDEL